MNKEIVFCGGGNMAEGIMKALISKQVVTGDCITVNELLEARRKFLTEAYGVTAVADASAGMRQAGLIIIAVNPHQVESVTKVLRPLCSEKAVIISIAAGVTLETLKSQIGSRKIARVVPNTLSQSGNGYSAVCVNELCDDRDKACIEEILNALGQVMYLRESMFNSFSSFSNVGPLWLYKTVEALIDSGVYIGFGRDDARNIVIKNMLGVAQVLEQTQEHPAVRADKMTSPGGVTIEALKVLQQEGFAAAIMSSVTACFNKLSSF